MLDEATAGGRAGAAEVRTALKRGILRERDAEAGIDQARLDAGEAAAIALARDIDCAVLLDDRPARGYAIRAGMVVTGTLGVLLALRLAGDVELLAPVLDRLEAAGFRMTPALKREVLAAVGEG